MLTRILSLLTLLTLPGALLAAVPERCDGEGTDTIRATTPEGRFHFPTGYDVVLDKETGLLWSRCPLGYRLDAGVCSPQSGATTLYDWGGALAATVALNDPANPYLNTGLADGWHLPNVKELASIVERQCSGPALNGRVFPAHPPAIYWTGTPVAQLGAPGSTTSPSTAWESQVWAVNMNTGAVTPMVKSTPGVALPVRELSDSEFQDWLSR